MAGSAAKGGNFRKNGLAGRIPGCREHNRIVIFRYTFAEPFSVHVTMPTSRQNRRTAKRDAVRRGARLWVIVGILSCLLAIPAGSLTGTTRVWLPSLPQPAEEESQPRQSPTEEEGESISCPVSREDWFDGRLPPTATTVLTQPPGLAEPTRAWATPPAEHASRNGCGGPLHC